MAILRFLNFDWDQVTKFRKLVSKKKVTELESLFKEKFIREMTAHTTEQEARGFWVVINKCGEYMFNKSHAVSYSILGYWSMWLKVKYPDVFVKHYMNETKDDMKRREMLRECVKTGWSYGPGNTVGFRVLPSGDKGGAFKIHGSVLAIKGIGPAKAAAIAEGKIDKSSAKAIQGAIENPAAFSPWAALDDFGNRHRIGSLPEGEISVTARVWEVKDNKCILEDVNGAEKAYFDQAYTSLESGQVYRLAISKFKYAKIDSARKYEPPK